MWKQALKHEIDPTILNCNKKWCRMFIKIGGHKHLNKRKRTHELNHMTPIRSMIGAM